MGAETLSFQAEVARLLNIVTHSLYTNKEIFLRELISNASDACDKLRYLALTEPALLDGDATLGIRIEIDKPGRRLAVIDNGIGMNRDDLVQNLGTIAKSGTAAFVEGMAAAKPADMNLIGQFGVGFYSAFMVADRVEVTSRKAGENQGWRWASEGAGSFTVEEAGEVPRGTRIELQLNKEADEFLERARIDRIVKTYSDHIALPITVAAEGAEEKVNSAAAIWARPKADITEQQHREFYHHVGHAFDAPWLTIHQKAEGTIEYTMLLYVPSEKPFDLFDPDRKHKVKLYVRRVFVTDHCEGLVPAWLRFLRGVVDSEDLPLNISRETLQANPIVQKIRNALVRKVLSEIEAKAKQDAESFAKFWDAFGAVLKEGLYEDFEHRDRILKLARFRSTEGDALVTLDDYIGRMKEGQSEIYFMTGEDLGKLKTSPQLEGFKAKGIEVLLLTDPVDDFWTSMVPAYEGKALRSVTRGGIDLGGIKGAKAEPPKEEAAKEGDIATLIAVVKTALGEAVKDVRASDRLTESPVCLVAAEGDMDMRLARLLRQTGRAPEAAARILELNPRHALVKRLAALAAAGGAADQVGEAAHLLFDQARILEGEGPVDPAAFVRRLNEALARNLAA
ncbi:molecular chaperone HtpG [Desertibaculum subflavum]|uniref:molecular chaperone HtpG n=1 Tax=Desertibaculum subflavum TaxID=2268458 RepID=UPI000E669B5F